MRRLLALLLAAAVAAGCAITTDRIHIDYAPDAASTVSGAEQVRVVVTVVDARTIRDKVSCKKNGYGMEMAPIVADRDVTETVADAITAELRTRGFAMGDGGATVHCELQRFYNDFKVGFFAGDALAEVVVNVQVRRPDGTIVFVHTFVGEGKEPNTQINGGHNAKAALDRALKNAVLQLVDDRDFLDALLRTPA